MSASETHHGPEVAAFVVDQVTDDAHLRKAVFVGHP